MCSLVGVLQAFHGLFPGLSASAPDAIAGVFLWHLTHCWDGIPQKNIGTLYLTRHEKGHSREGHLQGLHLRCTCRLPRVPPSSGAALGRVTGTSFSTSGVRPLSTTPRHFGFVQWPPSFSLFTSLSLVLPILNTKDTRPGVDPICERIHCRKDFQNAQPSYNPGEINQGGEGGA